MEIGRDEETARGWNRFWGSGKVDDYLSYKASCKAGGSCERTGNYAGFDGGDGNHIKDDPRGGV